MKFLPSMNLFRCQIKGTCLRMRGLCKTVSCKVSFKNKRWRNFCAARVTKEDKHVCANPRRTPSVNTLFGEQVANLVTRLLKRFPFWGRYRVKLDCAAIYQSPVRSLTASMASRSSVMDYCWLWQTGPFCFYIHIGWINASNLKAPFLSPT